jgi:hypothetical protein
MNTAEGAGGRLRGRHAWVLATALALALVAWRCGGGKLRQGPPPPPDDAGSPPVEVDAGAPPPAVVDAGAPDAGVPAGSADAGSADAGSADAGQTAPPPPVLVPPSTADRQIVPADGLLGASADEGGNVWAVSEDALWLLRAGAGSFEHYELGSSGVGTSAENDGILSVAGGAPGQAWVGYKGLFVNGESDDPSVPLEVRQSGGADLFQATPGGIQLLRHVMFWTPPGVLPAEPLGRWKVRSIFAIAYNHGPTGVPGDVFFGGTHGMAMVHANGIMEEHQHAGYNYCPTPDPASCSLVAGDHHGVAIHPPTGNVWIGADFAEEMAPYMTNTPHELWVAHTCESPWALMCAGKSVRTWVGLSVDPTHPEYGGRDFVQAMAFDANGDLWVGSYFNGLARLRIDPATGLTRAQKQGDIDYWNHRFGNTPAWPGDARNGTVWDFVWTVAGDPDGSLWVGTPHGAWRFVAATGQWVTYNGLLPGQNVAQISLDPRPGVRAVYFATNKGLTIYRGN